MKHSLQALFAIAVAALGVFLLVRTVVRMLLYPAPPLATREDVALGPHAERIWLETASGRVEAFHLEPPAPPGAPGPLVIYAHGNGELIDSWIDQFEPLRAAGVSVLLVEYPGYGRSSGTPSEASISRAMVAAFDWAASQPSVDRAHIFGWGRSLGGGAICALARERPLAALVLESTFTSIRAMAARLGFPAFLVRDPFDNLEVASGFAGRILLLHGDRDESIPFEHARSLHAAAPHSELHALPCGHNDCARPWPLLEDFFLAH
jgi:fermentation-respiration switch protein FrsA (DUF1100 family)